MGQGVRGQGGRVGGAYLSPAPPHKDKGTTLVGYAGCVCDGGHSWAPLWGLSMDPCTGPIPGQGTCPRCLCPLENARPRAPALVGCVSP